MNLNKRIITLGLIAFLSACSNAEKRADTIPLRLDSAEAERPADLAYQVRSGDFLSRIAKKTTGDGENWREIAQYNDIKNPNKLNKNDTVMIPGHLLPQDEPKRPAEKIVTASTVDKPKIREPKPNKTTQAPEPVKHSSEWVMVEGSYYPKAIYRNPNYTGGMLTRVLPGTKLKYIKSGKNWIQVETEKGRGYLHRSDARRLSKNELSLKTSSEY